VRKYLCEDIYLSIYDHFNIILEAILIMSGEEEVDLILFVKVLSLLDRHISIALYHIESNVPL